MEIAGRGISYRRDIDVGDLEGIWGDDREGSVLPSVQFSNWESE